MNIPDQLSRNKQTLLRKIQQKKYRYREQLFLLEGVRSVQQVIENEWPAVSWICFDEDQYLWEEPGWQAVSERFYSYRLDAGVFAEVTDTQNPQGVLAVCRMPAARSVAELASGSGLLVALDRIQDPGNLGTMVRSATWFGAAGLLVGKGTVDLFHPKTVRSTAGATGALPYAEGELSALLEEAEEAGRQTVLLDGNPGAEPLKAFRTDRDLTVVIGNEANGVDAALMTAHRQRLRIEKGGGADAVESLNASIALSIALYQLAD